MNSDKFSYHTSKTELILEHLETSVDGLSEVIAKKRLIEVGYNELEKVQKESALTLFINQFKDFVILILIFASLISILFGEIIDFIAILTILLLNAILGFYQEYKAEKSIEALQSLTAPHSNVFRDNKISEIEAKDIVPGDIAILEAGDVVPADCRILTSNNMYTDESALTGESLPVRKDYSSKLKLDTEISDQNNMLFMATNVVKGSGKAIVVRTGMKTSVGKIATLLSETEKRETPLKRKLNEFGIKLGWIILAISAFIVILGTVTQLKFPIDYVALFDIFVSMLIVGVALAVAAIPEGLPAVVTVALSIGVIRMSREKAIIRNLDSVETLGSTTVICTDKTGTLTQNKMTVEKIALAPFNTKITISDIPNEYKGDIFIDETKSKIENFAFDMLMITAVCCNNSRMISSDLINIDFKGDPTEVALLIVGYKQGYNKSKIDKKYLRLLEFPFDSERKLMSTINKIDSKIYLLVKGAPDIVRDRCISTLEKDKVGSLNEILTNNLKDKETSFSREALRVLAFAYKELSEEDVNELKKVNEIKYDKYESDLTLIGLMGMKDPPRPEAITAIKTAQNAGIRVVMVTGDHKNTAIAIGRQMGLIGKDEDISDITLTGPELKLTTDEELINQVKKIKIYARVSPEHKLKIVTALQNNNEIVAMTGDGVNDAPALKQADIGVAMGLGGTDVAKQASDMVLVDDNFATLEAAVEEGRGIFANMKKFIGYLLACNAGEVLTIFLGIIILALVAPGLPLEELLPLTALQLLYINLLTDGLPALALGVDPKEPNVMKKNPRDPNESIFNVHMSSSILLAGFIVGLGTLIIFFYELNLGLGYGGWVIHGADGKVVGGTIFKAQTMAFTVLIFFQKVMAFSSRSETDSLFSVGIFANKYLWAAVLFTASIHVLVIYLEPLQQIFRVIPLSAMDWVVILSISLTVLVAEELRKYTFRHLNIN